MTTRKQAMDARRSTIRQLKVEFKNLPTGISAHFNLMTHNSILWKNYMRGEQKFAGIDLRIYSKEKTKDNPLWGEDNQEIASTIKAYGELINRCLAHSLGQDAPEFVKKKTKSSFQAEEYWSASTDKYDVRYHIKNDANGWGRPQVFCTINFEA